MLLKHLGKYNSSLNEGPSAAQFQNLVQGWNLTFFFKVCGRPKVDLNLNMLFLYSLHRTSLETVSLCCLVETYQFVIWAIAEHGSMELGP